MHILFLTDNFIPESNAPAIRTYEHAIEWQKQGHEVTIITSAPNFPEGIVYDGFKNKWISINKEEGINIWRVKTYIAENTGFFKRVLDFISFMLSSLFFGLFVKRVDVVIGTSPQFFTVISAWLLSKIKNKPFIFELRDIWPASIISVGAMKNKTIINLLERLEIFLYQQADLIISVTHSFKKELTNRGISSSKIKVVLNGVKLDKFEKNLQKTHEIEKKLNLKDKFVCGYIGTHGEAHKLETIINAANLIKDDKNYIFLLIGSGSRKHNIQEMVNKLKLKNVILLPNQPNKEIQHYLALCDVSLVVLKDDPLFKTVIPSKIFESMAASIPIIMSLPQGEATKIIEDESCGIVTQPENPSMLIAAIKRIKEDRGLYRRLSNNSIISSKKYNRNNLALLMLDYLKSCKK